MGPCTNAAGHEIVWMAWLTPGDATPRQEQRCRHCFRSPNEFVRSFGEGDAPRLRPGEEPLRKARH